MDEKKLKKGYTGYELTNNAHYQLLGHIEPLFPDVIAHHVTYEYGVYEQLPPDTNLVRVYAVANNDKVQTALVKVNGETERPDGGTFHITLSLDKAAGAKAKDSNGVIANIATDGTFNTVEPFDLAVVPKFFSF